MLRTFCLSALVVLLLGHTCSAAIVQFTAVLNGAQERPNPVVTNASGTAIGTLNDVTGAFNVSGSFTNLSVAASNAHVHGLGTPDQAVGTLFSLAFPAATSGNFAGSGTLTAAQIAGALSGQTYVNIHSGTFPGGEIRGQLVAVPEPTSLGLLAIPCLALAGFRRRR